MLPRLLLTSLLVLGAIAAPTTATAPPDTETERRFTQTVRPFLDNLLHDLPWWREAGRAIRF